MSALPIPQPAGDPWGDWRIVEEIDDDVWRGGLRVRRAAFTAQRPDGAAAFGSAAALDDSSRVRARYELCERVAIVEAMADTQTRFPLFDPHGRRCGWASRGEVFPESPAPDRFQYARSNGVAIGATLAEACVSARRELIERDRLLRSWYGGRAPLPVTSEDDALAPIDDYDLVAARLAPNGRHEVDVEVAVIFCFPKRQNAPLLRGFGAADSLAVALAKAHVECLQSLAFLDDEPLASLPTPAPTPLFHLDYYLQPSTHDRLREWLQRRTTGQREATRPPRRLRFADITPQALLGSAVVVRALLDDAMPLIFGSALDRTDVNAPHPIA